MFPLGDFLNGFAFPIVVDANQSEAVGLESFVFSDRLNAHYPTVGGLNADQLISLVSITFNKVSGLFIIDKDVLACLCFRIIGKTGIKLLIKQ